MSLRKRIFFILASIFLLAAIPLVLFLSFSLFNTHKQTTEETIQHESHQILQSLDAFFFERIGDIRMLGSYNEIADPKSTRKEITPILKNFVRNYKIYDSITVLNSEGIVLAHSNQISIGKEIPNSFSIKNLFQNKDFKIWYEYEDNKINVMRIGFPLFSEQGTPFRIILFDITINRLHTLLKTFYSSDCEVTLFNPEGDLLYSNVRSIKPSLFVQYPELFNASGEILKKIPNNVQIRESQGRSIFSLAQFNKGHHSLKAKTWLLVVEQDYDIALKNWEHVIISTLGIIGIALLGIGYLLIPISNRISKPIVEIANIADQIGKGNFKAIDLLPIRDDELGILSTQMKEMVHKLEKSIDLINQEKNQVLLSMKAVEEANRAKDSFLAVMSHEMRTPLNAIIGFSQIIRETETSETAKENAQVIQESGNQLLQIVNDILDYSKIAHNNLLFEKIPFSVLDVVESSIQLISPSAQAKGLEVLLQIPHDFPLALLGDPHRLQQVINNLLANAIKFTQKGFVKISLKHESNPTEAQFSISIQDTGIGIEPQIIDKLFQPFVQADSSVTRKFGGTGLGLAISKKIIEYWNGEILLSSLPNQGSTFTVNFTLPLDLGNTAQSLFPVEKYSHPILLFSSLPELNLTLKNNLSPFLKVQTSEQFEVVSQAIKENQYRLILLTLSDSHLPEDWHKIILSSATPCLLLCPKNSQINLTAPHRRTEKPVKYKRLLKMIAELLPRH